MKLVTFSHAGNTRIGAVRDAKVVDFATAAFALEPGDVIFTGTPGGVGGAMKPPRFLAPGDRVRVEIDGIGALENVCAAEDKRAVIG